MFGNPDDFLDEFWQFDQVMNDGKTFNPDDDDDSEDDDNG